MRCSSCTLRLMASTSSPSAALRTAAIADAICEEIGLIDVEYQWTGGAGGGRGWAGDVRVMQLAIDRIKATGWRPRRTSEAAIRAAAKDAWASLRKPKARA